jgi:hypothetical protein
MGVEQSGLDKELMDRPLYLNHLLRVYDATGAIADRPSDLYGQLVRLMVHEWDEQRRVGRRSAIKGLDATTFDAVVREVAFRLTMAGYAVFTDVDLDQVLEDLGEQYQLDAVSGGDLLREIQAVAGFVIESPHGFEFSHLTLQEYLCAHHVVLRPSHKSIERMLRLNPEIAAVCVAVSSDPTDWLLDRVHTTMFETPGQIGSFVGRLAQERPRFKENADLGRRLLQLMSKCWANEAAQWAELARIDSIYGSVERAVRHYHIELHREYAELALRRERPSADRRRIPRYRVPRAILEQFPGLGA